MMKNNPFLKGRKAVLLLAALCWCLPVGWAQNQRPEKVPLDDNRWKTTDNITVHTDNRTKRTEELEHSLDSDYFVFLRVNGNNLESFRPVCKFEPEIHQETDAVMHVKLRWNMKDERGAMLQPDRELDLTAAYEAELNTVAPDNGVRIQVLMQATLKDPVTNKVMKEVRGQPRRVFVDDPNLEMKLVSLSFNNEPGKVAHDAFDLADTVRGKLINEQPEFKDGKLSREGMIVVYPVKSTPVVKAEIQLNSKRLPGKTLLNYDWGGRAEPFQREGEKGYENNILKKMKLQGKLGREVKNNGVLLTGLFESEKPLGHEMTRGKIDLEWILKWEGDDVALKRIHRATVEKAYLILRQKEIEQKEKCDTRLWAEGVKLAVEQLSKPGAGKDPVRCSDAAKYAEVLVNGIYLQSWYPGEGIRNYHRVFMDGSHYAYDIYLKKLAKDFLDNSGKVNIICVEAAALFRAMHNLVTDGVASAVDVQQKAGLTVLGRHEIAVWSTKVYDGTPVKNTVPVRPALPGYRTGACTVDEYNKTRSDENGHAVWSIFNENVKHSLISF